MGPVQTRSAKRKAEFIESPVKTRCRTLGGVVTWNMEGSGGSDSKSQIVRSLMKDDEVNAICLQECGSLFNWAVNSSPEPNWYVAVHEVWSPSTVNDRCSLAILTRGQPTQTKVISANSLTQRPLVGVKILGNYWVWTVHAPARRNGAGDQAYIQAVLSAANSNSGVSWICAGDFNADLLRTVQPVTGRTCIHPGVATRGEREYDYAYVNGSWKGEWRATRLLESSKSSSDNPSDHGPVKIYLQGR
jgi:hypothetical protein